MGMVHQHAAMRLAIATASGRFSLRRMSSHCSRGGVREGAKAQSIASSQTQTPASNSNAIPAPDPTPAQTPPRRPQRRMPTGKNEGNYTIQQSIEFGYRDSMIGGNLNNYDTFENLSSGMRLFDYTVDMRSINHQGIFFDNLVVHQFRLWRRSQRRFAPAHRQKQVVRLSRHVPARQEFLELQSARESAESRGELDSGTCHYQFAARAGFVPPHARLRSDTPAPIATPFPLGVFPQRQYGTRHPPRSREEPSRCSREELSDITNSYRMGVDYRGLSKTTLSFDEMLTYSAMNNTVTGQ